MSTYDVLEGFHVLQDSLKRIETKRSAMIRQPNA